MTRRVGELRRALLLVAFGKGAGQERHTRRGAGRRDGGGGRRSRPGRREPGSEAVGGGLEGDDERDERGLQKDEDVLAAPLHDRPPCCGRAPLGLPVHRARSGLPIPSASNSPSSSRFVLPQVKRGVDRRRSGG